MANFFILSPTFTTGATITANDEVSTLPASNLSNIQPSYFWRSTADTGIQITIDAGAATAWKGVFLGYHNGTSSGTLRVTSNATTGTLFSGPSYDSGTFSLTFTGDLSSFTSNHTWFVAPSEQTFQYVGLEIQDGTNPDGYVEAGVVIVGSVFEPNLGPDIGSRFGINSRSVPVELVNGETIVRPKRHQHVMALSFVKQLEADVMTWNRLARVYKNEVPLVWFWDRFTSTFQQEAIIYGYASWPNNGPITFTNKENLCDVEVAVTEV